MKRSRIPGALCAAVLIFITQPSHAILIGVLPATPGGNDWQAYYDDAADLSWLANANMNGTMAWQTANTWAAGLDINGVTDWRLPSSLNSDGTGPCEGSQCYDSEMGNMWFYVLGNSSNDGFINAGPFTNLVSSVYWSSTEWPLLPTRALAFYQNSGLQNDRPKYESLYAWAVHPGNVGEILPPSPVPVPAALWLFASGLVGLIGLARREPRALMP